MYPTQLHSYLLWRASVKPDAQALASRRHTATVCLLPAAMVGVFVFGWWALTLIAISVVSALATDLLCRRFLYRDGTGSSDGVWLLTGLLLALMMPPNAPWWLPLLGSGLAVFLGKYYLSVDNMPLLQPAALGLLILHLLGALGLLFFHSNPMLAIRNNQSEWPVLARRIEPDESGGGVVGGARQLLRGFFGGDVTNSISEREYRNQLFSQKQPTAEAKHGPRPLELVRENPSQPAGRGGERSSAYGWPDMLLGYLPATIGGSSGLALFFGILMLLFTGSASWVLPFTAFGTMFGLLHLMAWASDGTRVLAGNIPIHLLTGSTLLGIFYLAADPTTAPRSFTGKVYAGVAVGALEVLLRTFTPLAEGIFLSAVLVQGLAIFVDQHLAPPGPAPVDDSRIVPASTLTSSSLGRL